MPSLTEWITNNNQIALAAFAALTVSSIAFISNPKRRVNFTFLTISIHVSLWLLSRTSSWDNLLTGIRITALIGSLLPVHLWILTEIIVGSVDSVYKILKKGYIWLSACICLASITYSETFFGSAKNPDIAGSFGINYYIYAIATISIYSILYLDSRIKSKRYKNINKIELQIVATGGCVVAILIALRMIFSASTGVRLNLQPAIIVTFYSLTVYFITTHKVLNSRQVFIAFLSKSLFILIIVVISILLDHALWRVSFPENARVGIVVIVATVIVTVSTGKWQAFFKLVPNSDAARAAILSSTRSNTRANQLNESLVKILAEWADADHVVIVSDHARGQMRSPQSVLLFDDTVTKCMRSLKWATPERMLRSKPSSENQEVSEALERNKLGVLVLSDSAVCTLFVGIGIPRSGSTFTYPHVLQIMEFVALIEHAFEKSYYMTKARDAEQLASIGLVGANLAHEIRNPLISIKTYFQLVESNGTDQSPAFFELIKREVSKIDHLSQQLLELAIPKRYALSKINILPTIDEVLSVFIPEAESANVVLTISEPNRGIHSPIVYSNSNALRQVLSNLYRNALQALSTSTKSRLLEMEICSTEDFVRIYVRDSGPGISVLVRSRLFEPFQSARVGGFGLGLAICRDILTSIGASITVEDNLERGGAGFVVTLPRGT